MNKIYFHGIIRTLQFVVTIVLPTMVFTSCSSDDDQFDDDQSYVYYIGISSSTTAGNTPSCFSAIQEAEKQFDSSFTLTGSQESCDEQAKAKFATAITILRSFAANTTDCKGKVIYALSRLEGMIASEQIDFVIKPQ